MRSALRERLEHNGIRVVQYDWVWDENDRCLLLAGQYEHLKDVRIWMSALESMGFELCVRIDLLGVNEVREGNC